MTSATDCKVSFTCSQSWHHRHIASCCHPIRSSITACSSNHIQHYITLSFNQIQHRITCCHPIRSNITSCCHPIRSNITLCCHPIRSKHSSSSMCSGLVFPSNLYISWCILLPDDDVITDCIATRTAVNFDIIKRMRSWWLECECNACEEQGFAGRVLQPIGGSTRNSYSSRNTLDPHHQI